MTLLEAKLKYMRAQLDAKGVVAHLPTDRLVAAFATMSEPEVSFPQWAAAYGVQITEEDNQAPSPVVEDEEAYTPPTSSIRQSDPLATTGEGGLQKIKVVIDEKAEKMKDVLDAKLTAAQIEEHNNEVIKELTRQQSAGQLAGTGIKIG